MCVPAGAEAPVLHEEIRSITYEPSTVSPPAPFPKPLWSHNQPVFQRPSNLPPKRGDRAATGRQATPHKVLNAAASFDRMPSFKAPALQVSRSAPASPRGKIEFEGDDSDGAAGMSDLPQVGQDHAGSLTDREYRSEVAGGASWRHNIPRLDIPGATMHYSGTGGSDSGASDVQVVSPMNQGAQNSISNILQNFGTRHYADCNSESEQSFLDDSKDSESKYGSPPLRSTRDKIRMRVVKDSPEAADDGETP